MNTNKGDNVDETVASEMDVELNPISQTSETSVTELNPVPLTPISTQDENKPDDTAAMMQLLLSEIKGIKCSFNDKFDEQSNKFDEKFTNLNDKFEEQSVKFDELKTEIKKRNDNLDKQCDKVIKKLDEKLIQIENQKVSNSDNLNNEFTSSKNDMILENDNENIGSDNEVFECVESERELRESIFVKGVQGLEFSFDVVVVGEEKSSHIFNKDESSLDLYLGDETSTNRDPWCFCVPHRWCSNYELMTPAYLERERV